jgi:hypothetical protein
MYTLPTTPVPSPGTFSVIVGDSSLTHANFDPSCLLGPPAPPCVLSIDVDFTFDPTQLAVNSVIPGSLIPGISIIPVPVGGSPTLQTDQISVFFSNPTNLGVSPDSLFTVVFDVNGAGPLTTISFANDLSADPLAYQLSPFSADVQITAPLSGVPIHRTAVDFLIELAMLALIGWAFIGRRAVRLAPS